MDADWSVECGAEDPTIAVPWSHAEHGIAFVDLRLAPEKIEQLAEAQQHAALAEALRAWNQPAGPIFTAKCDLWSYPAALFDAEDDARFAFAQACYIDLLCAAEEEFSSFAQAEARVRQWSRAACTLPVDPARCEWVLRRAWMQNASPVPPVADEDAQWRAGFATTLYVWGYGATEAEAAAVWAQALRALLPLPLARR